MKKISITYLVAGLVSVGTLQAQSIQDGVNDLYAERFKSAKTTFEKQLASNPNNIEATYWLGQTHLEMDDVAGAKAVYDKALLASANAPLVIVGRGQVDLIENKVSEARQRFEAAITMTRGKKGDDPVILNAVGRAITDVYNEKEKKGDINYAVQQLEAAALRDPKNAEIFLNLGNAYRKSKPGEAGGLAFQNYQKAIDANANFAVPYYRMAQLFYSQKNRELYEKYLNDAVSKDQRFAPAFYDLYYLYLGRDAAKADEFAKKYIANSDPDPQNDFLRIQSLWANKDFDGAIAGAKNIIAQVGADKVKARVPKMIADSYLQKKDSAAGKEYIDMYFTRANPEEIIANDYAMKADIYSAVAGQEAIVLSSYLEGLKADTVLENKVALLKKGAKFFGDRKQFDKEAALQEQLLAIKPNQTINDVFAATISQYRGGNAATDLAIKTELLNKGYVNAIQMTQKFPDQPFGWEWSFNIAQLIDTVKKDSIAVPAAISLLNFTKGDTVKYAKQITSASFFLANFYNESGDKAKAIEYLTMMMSATSDPANKESIRSNIEKLRKLPTQRTPATKPATRPGTSSK